jgi:hypothetical protein
MHLIISIPKLEFSIKFVPQQYFVHILCNLGILIYNNLNVNESNQLVSLLSFFKMKYIYIK